MKYLLMVYLSIFLSVSCSFFSEEGKAIDIAKYNIIQKQLKNPDSMYTENFKVVDSMKYRLTAEDVAGDYTLWFIYGEVTASNSFGGNVKQAYCVIFWSKDRADRFGTDYVAHECTRGTPAAEEVSSMKTLFGWDKYKIAEVK